MQYIWCFVVGGALCVIGQLLIDYTRLTPAKILVSFVVAGVFLTAVGVYEPLVELAGSGATVPLTGFGYALATGVEKSISEQGLLGIFTGGLMATSGGIGSVVVFGFLASVLSRSGDKS